MQEVYNEAAIRKKFHMEKFCKQLHVTKNYLCSLILRSLESCHYSLNAPLKSALRQVELLYEKGLYKECAKLLHKTKRSAAGHEKFLVVLECIEWEKELMQGGLVIHGSGNDLRKLTGEEKEIIRKLGNERSYRNIRQLILRHYRINNVARNKAEAMHYRKFIKNPLCLKEGYALSQNAREDFYYIHGVYNLATGNLHESYEKQQQLVRLIEQSPARIEENPRKYLSALANYYYICYLVNRYRECRKVIEKIRGIPAGSAKMQLFIFIISYERELSLYINTAEYRKGLSVVKTIEDGIRHYRIPSHNLVIFYFGISYLYFGAGEYRNSALWLSKILNDLSYKESRPDIYSFSKIIQLILLYELNQTDALEYFVKSTYRYLAGKKRLYKFELIILDFIRKRLSRNVSTQELTVAFRGLRDRLTAISRDSYEGKALNYFDFISWLESKIENRPFAEIVKEKIIRRGYAGINASPGNENAAV